MPIFEFRSEPVDLLLTVENTTNEPLEYIISSKGGERAYQLDVRGGRRFYQEGADAKETAVEELLATQAPFTGYGAAQYENSLFSILPLTPRFVPPVNYFSMSSRHKGELLPENPHVYRIRVDQLYDLSLGGFYRLTVRHVFPVQQPGPPPLPDDDAWVRYGRAEHRNRIVPGACEVAVSNAIDVFVTRNAMDLVR